MSRRMSTQRPFNSTRVNRINGYSLAFFFLPSGYFFVKILPFRLAATHEAQGLNVMCEWN
jgi:hypothetical protein